MLRESAEFKRGRNGEKLVTGLLQNRGCFVIPSYDYSGEEGNKAPKMQGTKLSLVLPDLDVAKAGERYWAEVKTKWKADFTRKTQRLEHGFSRRHYQDYQRVQAETGNIVWLFIYEERDGIVLYQRLDHLDCQSRSYEGGKMGRDGMIFFPRDAFKIFAKVTPKPSPEEHVPHTKDNQTKGQTHERRTKASNA